MDTNIAVRYLQAIGQAQRCWYQEKTKAPRSRYSIASLTPHTSMMLKKGIRSRWHRSLITLGKVRKTMKLASAEI